LSQAEVLPPAKFEHVAHLFDTYDYDRCLIGSVLERHQAGLIFTMIRWIHNAPSCITPVTTAT